jgi:hypothetical protein
MVLSAKVLWPLFPLLLLVVVTSLTSALVYAVRHCKGPTAVWLQVGALGFYLLAAIAAIASERGAVSAHLHRPFSLLTQAMIAMALYSAWRRRDRSLMRFNIVGWSAIVADTALHYLLSR